MTNELLATMRPIDRGIYYRRMAEIAEQEAKDLKALAQKEFDVAIVLGGEDLHSIDGTKRLSATFADGKKYVPNTDMFRVRYPDGYTEIEREQLESFRVRIDKKDIEAYFSRLGVPVKEMKEKINEVCTEEDVPPIYKLIEVRQ